MPKNIFPLIQYFDVWVTYSAEYIGSKKII